MPSQLVPIIVPVFLCALLGFGWGKIGVPFEREFLTRIAMNIGAPFLILKGIASLESEAADFGLMMAIGIAVLIGSTAVSMIVLGLLRQPLRSYVPPVVYGNVGNLGLPLCFLAFGADGLGLAVAIYLVGAVSKFTLVPLFQGQQPAAKVLLQTPIIYAALGGVTLLATDTQMPLWMANTVDLLAGLAIPLMLLALGHALSSFRIHKAGTAIGLAVLRLGIGFAMGWSAVWLFDLSGVMRGVVLIESTMPVAVFNFLLAARYNRHPEDVAGSILVSTVLAFLVLPFLLVYALEG